MAFTYGEYSESGDYTIKEKEVKYVKYLQSDGASYIDTGISYNNQSWGAVYKVQFDSINYWGTSPLSDDINNTCKNSVPAPMSGYSNYEITYNSNSKTRTRVTNESLQPFNTTNVFEFDFNVTTPNVTIINGVECQTPTTNISSNGNMMLYWSPERQYAKIRIYELKLYQDGALVRDFKPCLDTKNIPCMYDLVTEQYFYNQGSGEFVYHNENNLYLFADNQSGTATNLGNYRLYNMAIEGDSQGIENNRDTVDYVDCLIGDEASYIDTGIAVSTGYKIDITFMSTSNKYEYINSIQSYNGGIYGASTRLGYSYDTEPYGISLGLSGINIHQKNGGIVGTYGEVSLCYNKKYTMSSIANNVSNPNSLYLFSINQVNYASSIANSNLRIYDFKIYNAEGTLIQHLRPCLDTSKVPCMYDEVSQQYFYNQGSGTFGYKKKLRDFQPILDNNEIPCLMDKLNRKYYYNQGTGQFATQEQNYKRVSYLQGDGASYINTGLKSNTMAVNSYSIEIKRNDPNNSSLANQGVFGATDKNNPTDSRTFGEYYNYGYFANGGMSSYEDINNINGIITRKYIANSDTASNVSSQAEANVYLFALNGLQDSIAIKISDVIKIYYYKVWDGDGNLIQHFIPVLDQDNVPCMYDLVTETFFYNQGTGTFAYGIEELECPPVDYVDYIDNNYGVFKLDIERKANELIGVKYKFMFTDNTNSSHNSILSTSTGRDDGTGWIYFIPSLNGTQFITRMGWRASSATYNSSITFERHKEYEIEFDATSNKFIVNGVEMADTTTNSNSTQSYSLYLFSNDVSNVISNMRVYYVDIYKDYKLVGSYRPCLDSNGEICFYNSVNGNYIYQYNEDTTPTVGDTEITPIKYIESDGTQYIDTGVRITDNTDIDMVCRKSKEYTQVEYLQGDGNSWLNLNIIPDTTTKVVVDFYAELNDCFNGVPLFASRNTFLSYSFQTVAKWLYVGKLGVKHSVGDNSLDTNIFVGRHTVTIDLSDTVNVVNVDGVNYGTNSGTTTECTNPILIFNDYDAWNTTRSDNLSTAKIYSFKIYQSDELVFDGIPSLYQDGAPGMYDLVTETFFYNQGTGNFAYGDIITKNYIMNNLYSQYTYKYQDNNTTVQSNLMASEGATLTLGETNLAYLSEKEIEDATNDGWNLL